MINCPFDERFANLAVPRGISYLVVNKVRCFYRACQEF